MSSFYWYDLETFGISPKLDRIAQFAGIRTDLNLNVISEPDMFYCQPQEDNLVSPEACLVTGITPQECQQKGILECEFMDKINDIFTETHTCVVGYNSIRFDDEFIRYGNYRNLIDPYMREWANGNSRWDLIDLVRACYALRPEGIHWPMHEEGKPSFKLTDLTQANNLKHASAHDALSDVEATIQMAKLIKQKQPKLFDYCLSLRNKNTAKSLLNWQLLKPIVHVSNKIPANRGCLAIMLPLAIHPTNPNGVICYDLAFNPDELFELDVEDIRDRIFTPQDELPEDCERIAIKTIHINKSPIVAPLNVLKDVDLERIQLDYALNKSNLEKFKTKRSILSKVQEVFHQKFDDDAEDVDGMLYSGFFTPQDKQNFSQIKEMPAQKILESGFNFKDPRAEELVFRFVARNYPSALSVSQSEKWQQDVKKRMTLRFGEKAHLWFENLKLIRMNTNSPKDLSILDALENDTLTKISKFS